MQWHTVSPGRVLCIQQLHSASANCPKYKVTFLLQTLSHGKYIRINYPIKKASYDGGTCLSQCVWIGGVRGGAVGLQRQLEDSLSAITRDNCAKLPTWTQSMLLSL